MHYTDILSYLIIQVKYNIMIKERKQVSYYNTVIYYILKSTRVISEDETMTQTINVLNFVKHNLSAICKYTSEDICKISSWEQLLSEEINAQI